MPLLLPIALLLAVSTLATAAPVISEFQAANTSSHPDGNGNFPDWIELHNPSPTDLDLAGYQLLDSSASWTFPSTTIPAGGYLVVFASGQNDPAYTDAAGSLHTTFKLDDAGETITLLDPAGTTASSFTTVPPQRDDVSYGTFTETTSLVGPADPARLLVPTSPTPDTWRSSTTFDDASWLVSDAAVGFNLDPGPVIGGSATSYTAYLVPGGTTGNQAFDGTLGMDFVANTPLQITHLGVFDSGSDGLSSTITASLYHRDDNGTPGNPDDDSALAPVATLKFSPPSPGTLENGSRFKPLASPASLPAGPYTIVASGYSTAEPNGNVGLPDAAEWEADDGGGKLTFVGGSRWGAGAAFPANPDGGPANRYAAGTFKFNAASDNGVATDIRTPMHGSSASALLRIPFTVADPAAVDSLQFEIGYDDGFVAYLNGTQIAARNAPQNPAHDSAATAAGNATVTLPVPLTPGLLNTGPNLLALHGLNLSATDRDFIVTPKLQAVSTDATSARYFTTPTPGAPNDPSGTLGFVADTKFSTDRGHHDTPFDLEITTATDGAEIRYTTDGSEPAHDHGTVYTTPINIDTTTVVRAAAFRDNFQPSNTDTHTYLFLDHVAIQANNPSGYPTSWAGTSADYAMDQNRTDYARAAGNPDFTTAQARTAIVDSLKSIPSLSVVTAIGNLFDPATGIYVNPAARGRAWERRSSVELILPDGTGAFQEDAGLRMLGFSSRNIDFKKLHFRLFFRSDYGAPKLRYPFFGDDATDRIDTIVLRGNLRDSFLYTNNASYLGDEWAKVAQREMGQPAVHGTFVHLYLNGIYWGLYNPTERPDAQFAEAYLGDDVSEFDAVKFCCPDRVVDGSMAEWNQLLTEARRGINTLADYYRVQGLDGNGNPDPAVPALLDVDNLIDYLINGQYHGSGDWPGNYYAIRDNIPGRTTGYKFFTWDNDLTWDGGNPNAANKVNPAVGNNWWTESPGEVHIGLRNNPEYRLRFADHVYRHYFNGGALTVANNLARWDRLARILKPALYAESARWGDARSSLRTVQNHWQPMDNRMRTNYFPRRGDIVVNQLRAAGLYPDLHPPEFNQRGGTVPHNFPVRFTATPGSTVYYTTDGTDPRLPGGQPNPDASTATSTGAGTTTLTLLPDGAPATAIVPDPDAPDTLGQTWTATSFDDATWQTGTTGAGYENGTGYQHLLGLDLKAEMLGRNATLYLRVPFTVDDPASVTALTLQMKYDDGFVAYLNGTRVTSANEPATLTHTSSATTSHSDTLAESFKPFDLTPHIGALRTGKNLLAFHGLNQNSGNADMLVVPKLDAAVTAGGTSIPITNTTTISARTKTGNTWSALNAATFIVGNSAGPEELVLSELHYHPAPATPEETAAGYTASHFEFLELLNTTATPLDLTGAHFTAGINFTFPQGTTLASGQRLLVVASIPAFTSRNGPATIAGEFANATRLANSGETLTLNATDGSTIFSLRYDDKSPWPESPDGDGPSLVIKNPHRSPDLSDPTNFRPSTAPGGNPGTSDATTFAGDPLADLDRDGLPALLEYALGLSDQVPDPSPLTFTADLILTFPPNPAADDILLTTESSTGLTTWQAGTGGPYLRLRATLLQ
ncbi:MAG: lamin tail domain-containing protein [Verrucomicrobiales bacterium]|nr:lamin tail domain-containing protein [Verrucomicrobiales bacterium]